MKFLPLKRSKEKKEEIEVEKSSNVAAKLINLVGPTRIISYPTSSTIISNYLAALHRSTIDLNEEENKILKKDLQSLE